VDIEITTLFRNLHEVDVVRLSLIPLMIIGVAVVVKSKDRKSGRLLMLIGILHAAAGGFVGRRFLLRMFHGGILGEGDSGLGIVPSDIPKEMMFWFLILGPFIFLLGYLLAWIEGEGKHAPASIGWQLLAVSLAAIVFDPKGGFWFLLLPAIWIIRDAKKREP
jgi:hypothetical protein